MCSFPLTNNVVQIPLLTISLPLSLTHTHTQGQALVVAALATLVSIVFGRDLHPAHMLLLGASSLSTAAIASFLLGAIMITVIVISYVVRINPDNVATPIAASLGDLVTLGLLSIFANWLYDLSGESTWQLRLVQGFNDDVIPIRTSIGGCGFGRIGKRDGHRRNGHPSSNHYRLLSHSCRPPCSDPPLVVPGSSEL